MACYFSFINESAGKSSYISPYLQEDDKTVLLWRNINRYSTQHLINVILKIIYINKWKSTDKLCIKCGCHNYTFQNNILFDKNNLRLIVNDNICQWIDCPVCTSKE
jgi:hypothetical protein